MEKIKHFFFLMKTNRIGPLISEIQKEIRSYVQDFYLLFTTID